jgi:hypothetical protein
MQREITVSISIIQEGKKVCICQFDMKVWMGVYRIENNGLKMNK